MKKLLILLSSALLIAVAATSCGKASDNQGSAVVEKDTGTTQSSSSSNTTGSSAQSVTSQASTETQPATTNATEENVSGNWVVSATTANGKKQDVSNFSNLIVTFQDGFFSVSENGEISVSGTYTLDGAVLTYSANGVTSTMEYTVNNTLIAKDKTENGEAIITTYSKM